MQRLLIADPQPLVERLGRDFFRNLPERAGVYLMRDAGGTVLYVGKAKNLRRRLASYRVANPGRMARRHLRLLRAVSGIEWQECADEAAALARETALLRALKPRFNRAGTWPATPRFVAWKAAGRGIELRVTTQPEPDWRACGPLGGGAPYLAARLARLLWLALNNDAGVECLPAGWAGGKVVAPVQVRGLRPDAVAWEEASTMLDTLPEGDARRFCEWVDARRKAPASPFDRAWLDAEFESLRDWFPPSPHSAGP